MNKLKKSLLAGTILVSSLIPQKIQSQNYVPENYIKIGTNFKRFNSLETSKEIRGMFGLETGFGKTISKDFRSEIYNSFVLTRMDQDSWLTHTELGAYFDYDAEDFYFGIGPKLSRITLDNTSILGYGLSGRIGYFFDGFLGNRNYLEVNYSPLIHKEGEEKLDLGTFSVSLGAEF